MTTNRADRGPRGRDVGGSARATPANASDSVFSHFSRERTWLLPALDAVQRAQGHVSADNLAAIAAHLRVPLSEVWGVATHYPELRLAAPTGRLVRVCTGVSCRVRGGDAILRECQRLLGAAADRQDETDTVEEMDCAFACGVAPVVEIGHAVIGRATVADVARWRRDASGPGAHGESAEAAHRERAIPVDPSPVVGSAPAVAWRGHSPSARLAHLRAEADRRASGLRLVVGVGSCGLAVGARDILEALSSEVARRGLAIPVVAGGCTGACWAAPALTVIRADAPPAVCGPLAATDVPRVLDAVMGGGGVDALALDRRWVDAQHRVLLEGCGTVDPGDIAD